MLAVTRWVAVAVGVLVLVIGYDRLFGGTRRTREAIERLDALANWTESLRDMVASGVALPEALPASVPASAPSIRPQLASLADRLAAREPIEAALRGLADDLDDGGADLIIAALILDVRAQGPRWRRSCGTGVLDPRRAAGAAHHRRGSALNPPRACRSSWQSP